MVMDKHKGLVSIVIVNWNGEKYLKKCIESLLKQSYSNIEIIIIDNDSSDDSVDIINNNFKDKLKLFLNKNTGYAGGSNKGIELSKGEFIVIANPDVVFEKNYIKNCVAKLVQDKSIGAVTGKLLKYDFEKNKKLNVIDSVGIRFNHSRQAFDIDQNELDTGLHEEDKRVFGVCGAAAIFKKDVLEKVKVNNEYFDYDFFAYKEDIDLCWRINLYGYKCYYVHDAIAYHGRGLNSSKGIINTIKNRKSQSDFLKGISFRNHYLMILKNETKDSYKKDRIKIYIGALKYIIFFILFDWKCLKYISQIRSNKELVLRKRHIIQKNIKLNNDEIYKLFEL